MYGSIDDGDPRGKNAAEGRNIEGGEGRGSQGCQPDLPMKKESSVLATDLHQDLLLVDLGVLHRRI